MHVFGWEGQLKIWARDTKDAQNILSTRHEASRGNISSLCPGGGLGSRLRLAFSFCFGVAFGLGLRLFDCYFMVLLELHLA